MCAGIRFVFGRPIKAIVWATLLVTSVAQFTHKSIVTLCAQGALIGVAGLLVLGESLS